MKMTWRNFSILVIVALQLSLVLAQDKEGDKITSDTTPSGETSAPSTTQSPVPPTSAPDSTTPPPETTTTSTPAPTTTTPAPTTTLASTTTTAPPPVLGESCSSTENCRSAIDGEVRCVGDLCACASNNFNVSSIKCLPISALKPIVTITPSNQTTSITCSWTLDSRIQSLDLDLTYVVIAKDIIYSTITTCSGGSPTTKISNCEGLVAGSRYDVTVTVSFGEHTNFETKTGSTVPAKPGKISATINARNVSLSWVRSTGLVDRYIADINSTNSSPVNTTSNTATFIQLKPATNYTATVVAWSNGIKSEMSSKEFKTLADTPDPPFNARIGFKNTTAVKLDWTPPTNPNGDIRGYRVCHEYKVYADQPYTGSNCENTTGSGTSLVKTELHPGAYYHFDIYTINELTSSLNPASTEVTMEESDAGAVQLLAITPGNRSLTVAWSRPVLPNGNITAYRLDWQRAEHNETDCTVYLRSGTFPEPENSSCSSTYPDEPIDVNQKNMSYEILHLQDYQLYKVQVTAYTAVGPGNTTTDTQRTSVAKPLAVTNVRAEVSGSQSVKVTWTLPGDRPGPVNYTVMFEDQVTMRAANAFNCSFQDKNVTSCNVTGLDEFWPYTFLVEAKTSAGTALSAPSASVTTSEAAPDMVTAVNVALHTQPNQCDATSITLMWTEPDLKDRNSNITKYRLQKLGSATTLWQFTVPNPQPYLSTNREFNDILSGKFPAERKDTYEIYAMSQGGKAGVRKSFDVTTEACVPPAWIDGEKIDIDGAQIATIKISYPTRFFTNEQQGAIKESGVFVAKTQDELNKVERLSAAQTWQKAREQNFAVAYRVKIVDKSQGRHRRSTIDTFTIGSNTSCTAKTDPTYFCNGPLPDGTVFYVRAYAETNAGPTFSQPFGPYQTLVKKDGEGSSKAWLAAVVVLAIIAIALTVVLGLMYFRGVNPKTWFQKREAPNTSDDESLDNPVFEIPRIRPLALAKYDDQLADLHKDTNLLFSDQYGDIGKLSDQVTIRSSCDNANLEPNKAKNRWVNILPYDHSRVKLQQLDEDDPSSDYINANYIPGFNNRREYIATQGPLPGTVDDFWRMIWEHNVQIIVMLTQCKEGNRVKCEKYWPDVVDEPKQYGDVVVNPVSISQLPKYCITVFNISMNNQSRQVFHFHYLHFPDFSANVEFDIFIDFVQTVRSHVPHDMAGPIVVHCREKFAIVSEYDTNKSCAGVGRTGTFIGVDRLDQYIKSSQFSFDDVVDIFAMVMSMRENRVLMVQTESQFIMIHDCLKMLLDAKKQTMEQEDLYINDAFDPYPEVLYENVDSKGELKTEL